MLVIVDVAVVVAVAVAAVVVVVVEGLTDSIDGWLHLHHHHLHQLMSFIPSMLSMMIIDIYMLY